MGSNLTGTWTEEKVAELKRLWNEGKTASQIAEALGFETRNPVCGKIDRLGLSGKTRSEKLRAERKGGKPKKARPPKPGAKVSNLAPVKAGDRLSTAVGAQVQAINRLKRADGPKLIKENFTPRVADVVSRRVTILEVLAMECRWADEDRNENGLHTFCGNPTDDGSSYCPAHAAIAVGTGTASERAATSVLKREAA